MAYDDLPVDPPYVPPTPPTPPTPPATETRNVLNSIGTIIGTCTLVATTPESIWSQVLAPYALASVPNVITVNVPTTTVSASSSVTTSSSSPTLVGGMTIKPAAGTYVAQFNGGIYTAGASAIGEFGIYVNGTLVAETRRDISCNLQLLGGLVTVSLNAIGVGTYTGSEIVLDGTQTVEVKFRSTNGGTIGFVERVLTLLKVK